MATEASVLPPSTASTSAGGGSNAASERNTRGSPAASFSMGMTMATPVIAFGSLQRPGPGRPDGRILTCHWHHARFELASGCTFDLWADDVPTCPVEIRAGGDIWVRPVFGYANRGIFCSYRNGHALLPLRRPRSQAICAGERFSARRGSAAPALARMDDLLWTKRPWSG
jgi:hypothetical protein